MMQLFRETTYAVKLGTAFIQQNIMYAGVHDSIWNSV